MCLADALARHGDTPFIVRSGSGHFQAWYRRQNEGRHIRPDPGTPIDILGDGFVVAPPSVGEKGQYEIISGSLADLTGVASAPEPTEGTHALEPSALRRAVGTTASGCTACGKRATATTSKHCSTWPGRPMTTYLPPLQEGEVVKVARSAWGYTERGQNFIGRPATFGSPSDVVDELLAIDPDAYILFSLLLRHHRGPKPVRRRQRHGRNHAAGAAGR